MDYLIPFMRVTVLLVLVIVVVWGCGNGYDHKGRTVLVEINGNYLYNEDLQRVLPGRLSGEDSILFAEHFIRNWIEEHLLLEKAESNIPENSRINELIDNYRRSLIIHTYQQELIEQKLSKEINEQELITYYEANKQLFIVEKPLLKGLFIQIPLTSPGIPEVRGWYKKESADAIDKLEKYSLQNAVNYDYFYDKWVPAIEVFDRIPLKIEDMNTFLKVNRSVEVKDTAFYYFLHISEYLPEGSQEPFESARFRVREIVTNMKQVDFIREIKSDLYQNAIKRNRIKYNY